MLQAAARGWAAQTLPDLAAAFSYQPRVRDAHAEQKHAWHSEQHRAHLFQELGIKKVERPSGVEWRGCTRVGSGSTGLYSRRRGVRKEGGAAGSHRPGWVPNALTVSTRRAALARSSTTPQSTCTTVSLRRFLYCTVCYFLTLTVHSARALHAPVLPGAHSRDDPIRL